MRRLIQRLLDAFDAEYGCPICGEPCTVFEITAHT